MFLLRTLCLTLYYAQGCDNPLHRLDETIRTIFHICLNLEMEFGDLAMQRNKPLYALRIKKCERNRYIALHVRLRARSNNAKT